MSWFLRWKWLRWVFKLLFIFFILAGSWFYLTWLFNNYRKPDFWTSTGIYCVFVILLSVLIWGLLELECAGHDWDWRFEPLPDKEDLRAIRLQKYEHLNNEITRYRDLSWKIPTLVYVIFWGARDFLSVNVLGEDPIYFFYSLAAICGTLFLLFCEHAAHRNKIQRRQIEETMRLESEWRYTTSGESIVGLRFLVSVGIFLLAIWAPPWIIFFYRG